MGQREGALEKMVIDKSFWKNRRVLITGHTGFKGSWLSLWLQQLGARVAGIALDPPTDPSLYYAARVNEGMTSHIADIRDLDKLAGIMRQEKPEIVIHMAAQSLVRDSYDDPVRTYSTNVMGSVNVLEAVRYSTTVKAVLNITSDKCYENREWVWGYRENEPMGGLDPYSNSKGCAELVTSAYRRSFLEKNNVALATARAGNVIGGGDWAKDRIIPDAIRAFTGNKPLVIRNPVAVRPWQHVMEPLSGYLILCQKLYEQPDQYSEAWNFGPRNEDSQPVSVLADEMVTRWGAGASWVLDDDSHPHEARYLKLDCSKASARLAWKPVWGLKNTLKETISWYKAWHEGQDMHETTARQITTYEEETGIL